jgi:hypothetical protein
MIMRQVFKTSEGARKHALFETNHCGNRWLYVPVRCLGASPDRAEFDPSKFKHYTWKIERRPR